MVFLSFVVSYAGGKCPSVRVYVMRAAGRIFFSILDCKPVLERSPKYLEVLFLFFRSFYFLRYFFDIFGVLFMNPKSENPQYLTYIHQILYVWGSYQYMTPFSRVSAFTSGFALG